MTLTTITVYALIAVTFASALATLASMFGGKEARTVQFAGLAALGAAGSVFMIQTTTTPANGIKGIGWIVSLPGDALLAMSVIGGFLVILGSLYALMGPVRIYGAYKSSSSIIGGRRAPRYATLRRQMDAFGKRIAHRSPDRQRTFTKND